MKNKKQTITQKARYEAARFYLRGIDGITQDWIDATHPDVNLEEEIDQDVRDMADLLIRFHRECKQEGL